MVSSVRSASRTDRADVEPLGEIALTGQRAPARNVVRDQLANAIGDRLGDAVFLRGTIAPGMRERAPAYALDTVRPVSDFEP